MLTTEQTDNWLTYHPPTDEQKPKYADIHRAEKTNQPGVLLRDYRRHARSSHVYRRERPGLR